jgi:hypothetical protein
VALICSERGKKCAPAFASNQSDDHRKSPDFSLFFRLVILQLDRLRLASDLWSMGP